jgi:phosphoribosyl-ATP pyrophosphohydrolase
LFTTDTDADLKKVVEEEGLHGAALVNGSRFDATVLADDSDLVFWVTMVFLAKPEQTVSDAEGATKDEEESNEEREDRETVAVCFFSWRRFETAFLVLSETETGG